jgi:hypothetical protein
MDSYGEPPMDPLWTPYGSPMDLLLWTPYVTPMDPYVTPMDRSENYTDKRARIVLFESRM